MKYGKKKRKKINDKQRKVKEMKIREERKVKRKWKQQKV